MFESVLGSTTTSDIAIDDVRLLDDACPPPGSCDFEDGICTWRNLASDDFDWTRQIGGTASVRTGPTADHTKNNQFGTVQ